MQNRTATALDEMVLQKDFYFNPSQYWSTINQSELTNLAQQAATVVPILSTGGKGIPLSMAYRAAKQMAQSLLDTTTERNDNVMLITGNDRLEMLKNEEVGAMAPCLAAFLSNELTSRGINVDIVYIVKEDEEKLRKQKTKLNKYIRVAKDAINHVLWFDVNAQALALGTTEKIKSVTQHPTTKSVGKYDSVSFTGRIFELACQNAKRVDVFAAYVADFATNPNPQWTKIHLFGDDDPDFNGHGRGILSCIHKDTNIKVVVHAFPFTHVLGNETYKTAFSSRKDSKGIEWTKVFENATDRQFDLVEGDGIKKFIMRN